jgi:hypothetical protein
MDCFESKAGNNLAMTMIFQLKRVYQEHTAEQINLFPKIWFHTPVWLLVERNPFFFSDFFDSF